MRIVRIDEWNIKKSDGAGSGNFDFRSGRPLVDRNGAALACQHLRDGDPRDGRDHPTRECKGAREPKARCTWPVDSPTPRDAGMPGTLGIGPDAVIGPNVFIERYVGQGHRRDYMPYTRGSDSAPPRGQCSTRPSTADRHIPKLARPPFASG